VRAGRLERTAPFSSADAVFVGSPADVARRFVDGTTARLFHLVDLDGAAASEPTLAAARAVAAVAPGVQVLLEGGLTDLGTCLEIARTGITPIADPPILDGPRAEGDLDALPCVLFGLHGDDDRVAERLARALERGLWGVVHHSTDAGFSCALGRRVGGHMPFLSRAPAASPDTVEDVIDHHRRLFYGGVPAVIVDGEWYVDYNTMQAPFDLLQ
jgi:hypothetical protein